MSYVVRKRRMALAKATNLYSSGLFLNLYRKGSKVSTNSIGERGQPCLVPLWMEKTFDRKPLTRTLATGLE